MYKLELETAKHIAYKAGDIMRHYFDRNQYLQLKADGSPLTIADTTINAMVIDELEQVFAEDIIIGEEQSTGGYGPGRRWLCDPVDGTKAFTWGVPTAMFSLALVIDGSPVVGVCYEPILDKMYWATLNGSALCNDKVLSVNNHTLDDGILATISSQLRLRRQAHYIDALLDRQPRINMAAFSGAVAKSVRVAEGRFVGYIEELVNPHDMAAVDLIVSQSGGKVTNFYGGRLDYSRPFQGAIVSNNLVHDELIGLIDQAAAGHRPTGLV